MIELVFGPMFSGKTEYLLSRASKYKSVGMDILAFKPARDTRSEKKYFSRVGTTGDAIEVQTWKELCDRVFDQKGQATVVLIDELQFMPEFCLTSIGSKQVGHPGKILWELRKSCHYDIKLIVAGLLYTTEQKPFPTMQSVLSVADKVTHLTALCKVCGDEAAHTICKVKKDQDVLVGDAEIYEARCGRCFAKNNPNW